MGNGFKQLLTDIASAFNASSAKNDEYTRKSEPSPWENPAIVKALTEPISDSKWRGMIESGQVKLMTEEGTVIAKADAIALSSPQTVNAEVKGIAAPKTAVFNKKM